jgi:N-acetyl-anhydromuramyl-L-alanine amidase AmpD
VRDIKKIIIHCSATRPGQNFTVDDIREWHIAKGWDDVGYHYVIERNGTVRVGRKESVIGSHAYGYNRKSIGICLIGGVSEEGKPEANYTTYQYQALDAQIDDLLGRYPFATVWGHRDLRGVTKPCPCFDVRSFVGY